MKEKIEVMQTAAEYLERVNSKLLQELDDIREGNNMNEVPNLVEGISALIRMFTVTEEYHSITYNEEEIKDLIAELLDATENLDITLVTDIVEYEFMPMLAEWEDGLREAVSKYE